MDNKKAILRIIKDIKSGRKESKDRIDSFRHQLKRRNEEHDILYNKLVESQKEVNNLKHLIEMYVVMDSHNLMDIWRLEKAIGSTKDNYPVWEHKYLQTKGAFKLKR